MLPPPLSVGPVERRSRERRAAERRAAAETSAAATDPVVEPGETRSSAPPPPDADASPVFRSRNGRRGRRKTDQDPSSEGDDEATREIPQLAKPHAPLVAQLIATVLDVEQTRLRRRGSMEDAAALYGRKEERAKPSRGEA